MDEFKRIFERMDIRQIRAFFLYGVGDLETDSRSYGQRLKEESAPLHKKLEELYPDEEERDGIFGDISQALTAYEQAYFEIGIKAGARLIFQLLFEA